MTVWKSQGYNTEISMTSVRKAGGGPTSDGLGFTSEKEMEGEEEEDEEVGVKSLLKKSTDIDVSELSESELASNRQQQEDELLVLQSIFGSDYFSFDSEGPAAFMINVHLEIPDNGIKISAEAAPQPLEGNADDNSFTVKVLPPISVLCVFPPTYPSHSAPLFELTCLWLSSKKLSSICASLDAVWEETSPELVVYSWTEWLRSEALLHVGASEKLRLELEPDVKSAMEERSLDKRAVSGSDSFNVDIFRLLRYNEEVNNKEFLESVQTCTICYSEFPGRGFTRLPSCHHFFCKGCMQQYCEMKVKDGIVMNLTCPDFSCKESMPPALLRELLDEELFTRWEDLLAQKTLDSMADVIYCPKCRTPSIEDSDHLVQCSMCMFSFCSLCMANWHPGQNCITPEARLRILQARQQGREMVEETLRQERELRNEVLDMAYIKKEAKQCPTCKMAVQKSEGCNKMTCLNCDDHFCFQCGSSITGYDHFRNSCELFDQAEINRWEAQFNLQVQQFQHVRVAPQNLREERAGARSCPNCKQVNYKSGGNNHIFCWSCQNHYCGLCQRMVRRATGHFGSGLNKCKQHTAD